MSAVLLWWCAVAEAGFPGDRYNGSVVVGANLVVAVGEAPEGGRFGVGVDLGWQEQAYTERSGRFGPERDFQAWAEEHPSLNRGFGGHLWWVGGSFYSVIGVRYGVTWPLRVGVQSGWWPGPGVLGEVGLQVSQVGAGLDLQGVVDAPWVQGRLGAALGTGGWLATRVHVGPFLPLRQPTHWSSVPPQWDGPDL